MAAQFVHSSAAAQPPNITPQRVHVCMPARTLGSGRRTDQVGAEWLWLVKGYRAWLSVWNGSAGWVALRGTTRPCHGWPLSSVFSPRKIPASIASQRILILRHARPMRRRAVDCSRQQWRTIRFRGLRQASSGIEVYPSGEPHRAVQGLSCMYSAACIIDNHSQGRTPQL